jgi:hypothetical protein
MTVAAKPRPKAKPKRATIVEAMGGIFRPWFKPADDGVDTWWHWKCVLKAMDGLEMSPAEIEFFKSIAGGREPPAKRVSELVAACARRTGKDSVASAIGTYAAATFDQQDKLRPGEKAQIYCLACDRVQSKIVLNYIRSYFRDIPMLASMVVRETKDGFELNNGVDIVVQTNSFRAVRGKPILLAILDEAAFMSSETSANPDTELYAALRPGMLTIPGSRMIIISSPYRKSGLLWDRYKKFFGENDPNTLVIQASVRQLNPTITQAQIDAETEEDPAASISELQGQFRDDLSAFLTIELIESAVDRGVMARAPQPNTAYFCGVDPSGGVSDSWVTAVAHAEKDGSVVLDALLETKGPFDPDVACETSAALIKSFGITSCTGDRYSAQFVVSAYAKRGVSYRHSERDRSKIYGDVLPLFTSGRARLLDTPKSRLVVQFAGLQRETSSQGRDKIDHAPGQKDDLANATALSMVLAAAVRKPMNFSPPDMGGVRPSFWSAPYEMSGGGGRPGGAPNPINALRRAKT